jgi:hypothetical protein
MFREAIVFDALKSNGEGARVRAFWKIACS